MGKQVLETCIWKAYLKRQFYLQFALSQLSRVGLHPIMSHHVMPMPLSFSFCLSLFVAFAVVGGGLRHCAGFRSLPGGEAFRHARSESGQDLSGT
jgi:hypothetical protein